MKELTEGILSTVTEGKVALKTLQKSMKIKNGAPVLVIGTKSNFLRVILLSHDEVAHIRVSLGLTGFKETARSLLSGIKSRELQLIHSTGFCPLRDSCVWEGYFVADEKDRIQDLCKWVRKLPGISDVSLKYLTP